MFLFHTGQLSPREIKQLDQGHPISGRDGTKRSFLITLIIIWLSRNKCHFPYLDDLKHIWLLNSEKVQGEGRALSMGSESISKDSWVPALQRPPEVLAAPSGEADTGLGPWWLHPHWQRRGPKPKQRDPLVSHSEPSRVLVSFSIVYLFSLIPKVSMTAKLLYPYF